MALLRCVSAEALDGLTETDPAAQRSRRDLQRVHRVMGTRATVVAALQRFDGLAAAPQSGRLRILELGAGDGSLMLGVARALAPAWPAVELTLLDRRSLVSRATRAAYAELGWNAVPLAGDVFDWAAEQHDSGAWGGAPPHWQLITTSLFLHHFEGEPLARLLRAIAIGGSRFFAIEPRRAWPALAGSHLIGALGANAVTRADAVLSVHAGFHGQELSALWPAGREAWRLREHAAGLFSHVFSAEPARLAS